MSNSKQKSPNTDLYSDYFIENNYFTTNQSEHAHYYKTHQRKSSQVSTRSCKSKLRNLSSVDKNHSNIKLTPHIVSSTKNTTLKTSKTDEKRSILKKEFSLDRMKVLPSKIKQPLATTRKEKLKIHTDRKEKQKLIENLTTRYIKYEKQKSFKNENIVKTDKSTSHNSILNKFEQLEEKVKAERRKHEREEKIIKSLKIKEKNLELVMNRCESVMTEYYQRIVNLRRENELLREENLMLKKEHEGV